MSFNKKNTYNIDAAWTKLHQRLKEDNLLEEEKKTVNIYRLVKIAAIFILSLSIGFWMFQSFTDFYGQTVVAETFQNNNIKTVQLPDGSTVDLNFNSRLTYPEKFSLNQRVVKLEGEAFFNIKKNYGSPFVIKVLGKEVKVMGTSFSIKTNEKDKQVKVFVKTGKVSFYEMNNFKKQLILEAGYMGTIDENIAEKQKIDDPNYLAWKTKYFDFSYGERLDKIIEKLNNAYHVNIELENTGLAKKTIYTTYDNYSLDKILQLISVAHNLKIEKKDNKIILK